MDRRLASDCQGLTAEQGEELTDGNRDVFRTAEVRCVAPGHQRWQDFSASPSTVGVYVAHS